MTEVTDREILLREIIALRTLAREVYEKARKNGDKALMMEAADAHSVARILLKGYGSGGQE